MICPKQGGGRVCEYMHARAIHNVLTQGPTVLTQGWVEPSQPPANHTLAIYEFGSFNELFHHVPQALPKQFGGLI